ncbi:UNVERIFIED_CONTAM: hypothetical protein FKN15_023118 [Acipenser sinensis]
MSFTTRTTPEGYSLQCLFFVIIIRLYRFPRNLTEYFVAVDVNNMLHLYASMLYERRILICCSKLSTLTACVHGSAAMLYPMYWQHVYIPVLPQHLIDYCCAPMPYLIGVHSSLMEKVKSMALEDVVILNVDTNTLETPFDDLQSLPNDVCICIRSVRTLPHLHTLRYRICIRSVRTLPHLHTLGTDATAFAYARYGRYRISIHFGTDGRVHEGDKMGLVQFPPVGSTIPALAQPANLALLSKDAACPNKQCWGTEVLLKKAYSANAFVARLGNYNTCLVAYQSYIWGSAAEGGLTLNQTEKLRLISRMLLRLAQLLSQATGRSMAALMAACRQLWLSQARLTENNKAALLDAPITPWHTFGPAVDDLLLRSKAAREATKAFCDLAPKPAPPPKKLWYQSPPPRPQWQPQGGPRGSPAVTDRSSRGRGRQRRFQCNAPDKRP